MQVIELPSLNRSIKLGCEVKYFKVSYDNNDIDFPVTFLLFFSTQSYRGVKKNLFRKRISLKFNIFSGMLLFLVLSL